MEIVLRRKDIPDLINKIVTSTNDPNELIKPDFEGEFIEDVKQALIDAGGAYGHVIDLESTTNLDISVACQTLLNYTVVSANPDKFTPFKFPKNSNS